MPHSILTFDVESDDLYAELKMPLKELQLAVPFDVTQQTGTLLEAPRRNQLADYLLAHLQLRSENGQQWEVKLLDLSLAEAAQTATGKYQELKATFLMRPPPGQPTRSFNVYLDAILHQVVTHKIFVMLRKDWQSGKTSAQETNLGVIELNIADNVVPPLVVRLDEGSNLKGFIAMVWMGIHHIAEGVDHLLFLLVLLLPATLLPKNGRWTTFAGNRRSILNILKIATAFTVGHSFSLLLGAMQWVSLPQQPVEIGIAITISLTAIHALRPIFANKEIMVAAVFGLVHGLAFSTVLSELHLDATALTYSILGYNIGIELMQVFVIVITIPWIVILSKNGHFKWVRIAGAAFAIVASLAWVVARITQEPNVVSQFMENILYQGKWMVLLLMALAVFSVIQKSRDLKVV